MRNRVILLAALLAPTVLASADGPTKPTPQKTDAGAEAKKALKVYHASAVKIFIDTPGFGHDRMVPVRRTVESITVQWSSEDIDREGPKIDLPALSKPHRNRDTMLGKEIKNGLRLPGTTKTVQDNAKKPWKLRSIDLVAVVDREMPIVYTASAIQGPPQLLTLPNGNQPNRLADLLKNNGSEVKTNTRQPDLLELAALDCFKDGEDAVIRTKGNVLRMVGALRATKQCLKCHHDSKVGDVFGAFTYTLTRAGS